ncbi:MAG: HAD-IA family hydrolase [Armatimonadetes bacterium]|nr:HAD-IA family hydrolase [Armatimonadota bacterium]
MIETAGTDLQAQLLSQNTRVLLWDIDGTLIDTTTLIVSGLDEMYRRFIGRTLERDELRKLIGIPLSAQMRALGDPAEYGVDIGGMSREFIRYYETHRHLERVIEPAILALRRFHENGVPTALVTSKNRTELSNTLPRLGITKDVDTIVSADDVRNPKPAPDSIIMALRRLEADPVDAVFIGDTVHDLQAGGAAGVRCCAVGWGAGPIEQLMEMKPDYLCIEPDQLVDTLVGRCDR